MASRDQAAATGRGLTIDCGEGKHGVCCGFGTSSYPIPQTAGERFECACPCHEQPAARILRERAEAQRERDAAQGRERFPGTPDHRLRSTVSFTLPSTGERWNWPVATSDQDAIEALCEILDRADIPWKVSRA